MKRKKYFICEICKEKTPIECEGGAPNVCADCVPVKDTRADAAE